MNTPTLHGCSTQNLHENFTNLSSLCVTWAMKNISFFFFTLTLSLCFSLFFGLHLSAEALSFVLLAHSGTHTKMAETLYASTLCSASAHHTRPNGLCIFLFLLFSSACLTHLLSFCIKPKADFGTLLIEKSDFSMLWSLLIKWKNLHWRLLE